MWIGVEAWDETAKGIYLDYSKGSKLAGVGLLLHNKWKDKATGEDRKQFKLRLTKVVSEDELRSLLGEIDGDQPITTDEVPWEEEVAEEDTPPPPSRSAASMSRATRAAAPVVKNRQAPATAPSRPKIRF